MLSSDDVVLVKEYFYNGFPELQGRVIIRDFNPSANDTEERAKERIRQNLLAQSGQKALEAFDRAVRIDSKEPGRGSLLHDCLSPMPAVCPVIPCKERRIINASYFYIRQFPDELRTSDIYKYFANNRAPLSLYFGLPRKFRRTAEIFSLAHEIGHIAYNNGMGRSPKIERICDAFGTAACLAIMDEKALRSLKFLANARAISSKKFKDAGKYDRHDTSEVLMQLLSSSSELKALRANNVPLFARKVCGDSLGL